MKQPWTHQEVAELTRRWARNEPIAAIAAALGRAPVVIRAKVSHLRSTRPDLAGRLRYRLKAPHGKLIAADIPGIRKDGRPYRIIGLEHHVSAVTIYKVKAGLTWRHA